MTINGLWIEFLPPLFVSPPPHFLMSTLLCGRGVTAPTLRQVPCFYINAGPLFYFYFFFANPLFWHFRLRVGTSLLIAINVIGRKLVLTLDYFFFLYIYLLFVNVGIVLGYNYGFQNI